MPKTVRALVLAALIALAGGTATAAANHHGPSSTTAMARTADGTVAPGPLMEPCMAC